MHGNQSKSDISLIRVGGLVLLIAFLMFGCGGGGGDGGSAEDVPIARIVSPVDNMTVVAGQTVHFEAFSVQQDDCEYTWDLGGAAPNVIGDDPGDVVLNTAGTFDVVLTVSREGASVEDFVTITVEASGVNPNPVALITSPTDDITINQGQSVNFLGSVSGGVGPYSYFWTFDGAAVGSLAQNPGSIVFNNMGEYEVTFTVVDGNGHTSYDTMFVEVLSSDQDISPTAVIVTPASNATIFAGGSVNFQGFASGGNVPLTYLWQFGGSAGSSTALNPGPRQFTNPGTYNVAFTATDVDGDTSTDSVTVTVVSPTLSLLNPAQGFSSPYGQNITFSWSSVSGAASYRIFISANTDMGSPLVNQAVVGTSFSTGSLNTGLYYWDVVAYDSLGNPSAASSTRSFLVSSAKDWLAVASGDNHNIAIDSDGMLWAWGQNNHGQVGDGTTGAKSTPVRIGTLSDRWIEVGAGSNFSFAIRNDGSLWAWGANNLGQLGDGTTLDRLAPVRVSPVGETWLYVDGGQNHSVGINGNNNVYIWGDNSYGQFGDGKSVAQSLTPRYFGNNQWLKIVAGGDSTAAIYRDGTLWSFGKNDMGQLGDGTKTERDEPVMIGLSTDEWTDVDLGLTFIVAIKEGELYGAGSNTFGQIGGSPYTERLSLTRIGTASDWSRVKAGVFTTLGIKTNRALWGLGYNQYGGLGIGTVSSQAPLTQLSSAMTWLQVASGYQHTVRIDLNGDLHAAGRNFYGQIGDGGSTSSDRLTPVQIFVP